MGPYLSTISNIPLASENMLRTSSAIDSARWPTTKHYCAWWIHSLLSLPLPPPRPPPPPLLTTLFGTALERFKHELDIATKRAARAENLTHEYTHASEDGDNPVVTFFKVQTCRSTSVPEPKTAPVTSPHSILDVCAQPAHGSVWPWRLHYQGTFPYPRSHRNQNKTLIRRTHSTHLMQAHVQDGHREWHPPSQTAGTTASQPQFTQTAHAQQNMQFEASRSYVAQNVHYVHASPGSQYSLVYPLPKKYAPILPCVHASTTNGGFARPIWCAQGGQGLNLEREDLRSWLKSVSGAKNGEDVSERFFLSQR